MLIDHWAATQNFKESFEDLSPAQISRMSFEQYARATGRQTATESAIQALDASYEPPEGATAVPAPPQSQPPADAGQGITDEQFLAWRSQRARGGEGRGIFDGVGSQSDAYTAADRQQAGRGGLSTANVVEPPRLTGRYVRQDDMRDTRPASQRFSTPGSVNNF